MKIEIKSELERRDRKIVIRKRKMVDKKRMIEEKNEDVS